MNPSLIAFDTVIRSARHRSKLWHQAGLRPRRPAASAMSRLERMMGYNAIALVAIVPFLFGLGLFLFYA